jgi:hypothetical protein
MPEKMTSILDKRAILAQMWEEDRDNPSLQKLFEYGDIGFPIASSIEQDIVPNTLVAEKYIEDLWDVMLQYFGVEDTGEYNHWLDIADEAGWEWVESSQVPKYLAKLEKEK